MAKTYNKLKLKIPVVSVLPIKPELGELVFLTSDSKIYVYLYSGWVQTDALS